MTPARVSQKRARKIGAIEDRFEEVDGVQMRAR
jgi:hypothetical protein